MLVQLNVSTQADPSDLFVWGGEDNEPLDSLLFIDGEQWNATIRFLGTLLIDWYFYPFS